MKLKQKPLGCGQTLLICMVMMLIVFIVSTFMSMGDVASFHDLLLGFGMIAGSGAVVGAIIIVLKKI